MKRPDVPLHRVTIRGGIRTGVRKTQALSHDPLRGGLADSEIVSALRTQLGWTHFRLPPAAYTRDRDPPLAPDTGAGAAGASQPKPTALPHQEGVRQRGLRPGWVDQPPRRHRADREVAALRAGRGLRRAAHAGARLGSPRLPSRFRVVCLLSQARSQRSGP